MSHKISLCITYIYHDPKGPRPSVYRIADYEDGEFFPVDPQSFTDDKFEFSPKFLRTRPGDELPWYVPALKEWKGITKYEDPDRMTTESFSYIHSDVLEVVLIQSIIDPDPIALQNKLHAGFVLPEGLCDTFLLVLDQDATTFTVAKCRKNMLKRSGALFFFDDNISDMLHATHYLETYVIEKEDVFDTSRFPTFYFEDRSAAPIRYFYKYDYLPENDGLFYLREMSEYIPFFVTRFLKKEAKKYELSKAQLQKVSAAIEEAAASDEALEAFFAVTGYDANDVKMALPDFQKTIMQGLLGYDEIDNIIASFFETNEEARERLLKVAKEVWLMNADDDRAEVEKELNYLHGEVETANEELNKLEDLIKKEEMLKASVTEEINVLVKQKAEIEQAAGDAVKHLESSISTHLSSYAFLKHFGIVGAVSNNNDQEDFVYSYPKDEPDETCKRTNEVAKASAVLQANLKKAGMTPYFANVTAAQIHAAEARINAYVISGTHARSFANAISNSINGHDATMVTVIGSNPNYTNIQAIIDTAPGRVVLIENLLDFCNEVLFSTLCRNNRSKTLIFGVNDECGLAIISKAIWNYAWYINTDSAFAAMVDSRQYAKVIVEDMDDRFEIDYSHEGYTELNNILLQLDFPLIARENIIGLMRFFDEHYKSVVPVELIDSLVAKLCSIYRTTISEDVLLSIVDNLPEKYTSLYFKQ